MPSMDPFEGVKPEREFVPIFHHALNFLIIVYQALKWFLYKIVKQQFRRSRLSMHKSKAQFFT